MTTIACDCGRVVPLDMATDVRAVPVALRGVREWLCDGCRAQWVRDGAVTAAEMALLLGATAAQAARIVAKHGERPPRPLAALVALEDAAIPQTGRPQVVRGPAADAPRTDAPRTEPGA